MITTITSPDLLEALYLKNETINRLGWKTVSLTRVEAFKFIAELQQQADEKGFTLNIIEETVSPTFYVGSDSENAEDLEINDDWIQLHEEGTGRLLAALGPASEEDICTVIHLKK